MICYCFSGLGADGRVFKNIRIDGVELKALDWIEPRRNENLGDYAVRLLSDQNTEVPFMLMGVSFGGMLAIEAAKKYTPVKLILISTLLGECEFPFTLKLGRRLKAHQWVPMSLMLKPKGYIRYVFGVTKPRHAKVLHHIVDDIDPEFFAWAMGAIVLWQNRLVKTKYIRIHGAKDRLIPVPKNFKGQMIDGAGHFMIRTHWRNINKILNEKID